jgi:hypothetical protein
MIRTRIRVLATSAVVASGIATLATMGTTGASSPPAPKSFHLVKVVTPKNLVANGPDRPITIYWAGNAVFPVTVQDGPRSCQAGYLCVSASYHFKARANPLDWVDATNCEGAVPPGFVFRYYIWAVDAKGHRTPEIAMNIPCQPG